MFYRLMLEQLKYFYLIQTALVLFLQLCVFFTQAEIALQSVMKTYMVIFLHGHILSFKYLDAQLLQF